HNGPRFLPPASWTHRGCKSVACVDKKAAHFFYRSECDSCTFRITAAILRAKTERTPVADCPQCLGRATAHSAEDIPSWYVSAKKRLLRRVFRVRIYGEELSTP